MKEGKLAPISHLVDGLFVSNNKVFSSLVLPKEPAENQSDGELYEIIPG